MHWKMLLCIVEFCDIYCIVLYWIETNINNENGCEEWSGVALLTVCVGSESVWWKYVSMWVFCIKQAIQINWFMYGDDGGVTCNTIDLGIVRLSFGLLIDINSCVFVCIFADANSIFPLIHYMVDAFSTNNNHTTLPPNVGCIICHKIFADKHFICVWMYVCVCVFEIFQLCHSRMWEKLQAYFHMLMKKFAYNLVFAGCCLFVGVIFVFSFPFLRFTFTSNFLYPWSCLLPL